MLHELTGRCPQVSKAGAAHEEAMQAAAEKERKERVHGKKGAEEVEEGAKLAGASGDVKNTDTGGDRREEGGGNNTPSENVLGAPPGPKTEEEAGGQPWGRGNW